ncbi:hypothetical protein [uncultured Flavobacterium sp.]|uniref:hypothetical protein n=1 Tax=uncultured Flavobacterium sp. TaxID=165435 RepID=UPI0030EF775F
MNSVSKVKAYNKHNFHKHTFCVFKEVSLQEITQLQPNYSSKSGSSYYFTEEGLYRVSNHWGRAANCRWKLDSSEVRSANSNLVEKNLNKVQIKVGYAKWTDFYPNNEQENLFYIQVDFEHKTVDFQHKNNPNYDGISCCRNASETAKRIKICKEVLLENNWFKYLTYIDLEELRHEIINELLTTNNSFIEIKRNYIK